jgi:hypothetical protein
MFNSVTLILLGGLVGIWILSSFFDSLIEKACATLSIDVRNQISSAESKGHMLWRLPDIFGVGLMLVGIIKWRGMIGGSMQWGIPAMTFGLLIICAANIFRSWQRSRIYSQFAPETEAAKQTRTAALATTVAEIILAATALYFVGSKITALFNTQPTTRVPNAVQLTPNGEIPTQNTNPLWVDEAAAVKLLQGRDAEYLEGLVKRKDVRMNVVDGKKLYRRDDIETMGEFPTHEELGLKKPAEAKK